MDLRLGLASLPASFSARAEGLASAAGMGASMLVEIKFDATRNLAASTEEFVG